jgi:hypothetical protein
MRRLFPTLLIFILCVGVMCGEERYLIKENTEELIHPENRHQREWPEWATVTSHLGQKLCAKHRTPFTTIRVYEFLDKPGEVTLTHDANHLYEGVALVHCPNSIPLTVFRHPSGRFRKPRLFAYCPQCEREYREALSVPNAKAAAAYATCGLHNQYGARPKGPFEITLKGDVWTVHCFLADGRRANIKFTKSDGAEISRQVGK